MEKKKDIYELYKEFASLTGRLEIIPPPGELKSEVVRGLKIHFSKGVEDAKKKFEKLDDKDKEIVGDIYNKLLRLYEKSPYKS